MIVAYAERAPGSFTGRVPEPGRIRRSGGPEPAPRPRRRRGTPPRASRAGGRAGTASATRTAAGSGSGAAGTRCRPSPARAGSAGPSTSTARSRGRHCIATSSDEHEHPDPRRDDQRRDETGEHRHQRFARADWRRSTRAATCHAAASGHSTRTSASAGSTVVARARRRDERPADDREAQRARRAPRSRARPTPGVAASTRARRRTMPASGARASRWRSRRRAATAPSAPPWATVACHPVLCDSPSTSQNGVSAPRHVHPHAVAPLCTTVTVGAAGADDPRPVTLRRSPRAGRRRTRTRARAGRAADRCAHLPTCGSRARRARA